MAGAAAVAGCSNDDGGRSAATPTPIDLDGQKRDDRGGMVIGYHGGPNGQIFYVDNSPEGHENPAWFHTLVFGLFPSYFERRQMGWEATAIYVTDYSTVEYDLSADDMTMPAPTAAETFGDATAMTYVAGSEASGGMGPELLPFSAVADADSFVENYGGRTVGFEDITPEMLAEYRRR